MKVTFGPNNATSSRSVGLTTKYDKNGRLIAKGYASTSGMRYTGKKIYSDRVLFSYEHAVGNPLQFGAPDIDWDYNACVWKNGKFRISGYHDRSPAHEIYIKRSGGKWKTIRLNYPNNDPLRFALGLLPPQYHFNILGSIR